MSRCSKFPRFTSTKVQILTQTHAQDAEAMLLDYTTEVEHIDSRIKNELALKIAELEQQNDDAKLRKVE